MHNEQTIIQTCETSDSLNSGHPNRSLIQKQKILSTSILYADNVTLMSLIKSKEEKIPAAASLNQDLCNIEKCATSWNVLFGAEKCKTVTLSNRQYAKDSHPCLQFFGTTLTETETVELLGQL